MPRWGADRIRKLCFRDGVVASVVNSHQTAPQGDRQEMSVDAREEADECSGELVVTPPDCA